MSEIPSIKQNFKATEEILLLLEKSKSRSESAIDLFPGIFVIMTENGDILRANDNFKRCVGPIGYDSLPNLFDSLSEESTADLNKIIPHSKKYRGKVFETEIQLGTPLTPFAVSLSSWRHFDITKGDTTYFTIVGQDLGELRKALLEKERMSKEIESAQQIQSLMMPEGDFSSAKFDLACYYKSAAECGGDFLHYKIQDDNIRIWSGDVTGHGVGPAMITGAIKSTVSRQEVLKSMNIEQAMQELNKCVQSVAQNHYWSTFQLLEFDLKKNKLELGQASHSSVYVLTDLTNLEDQTWTSFKAIDLGRTHPLGVFEEAKFLYTQRDLKPGSLYISFSDGLYEHINIEGKAYGLRRILKSFLKHFAKNGCVQKSRDLLLEDFFTFCEGAPLQDDISLWCFHYK